MTTSAFDSNNNSISSICSDLQQVSEQLLELRRIHPELEPAASEKRDDNAMDIDQQEVTAAAAATKPIDPALQAQFREGVRKANMLLTLLKIVNRDASQHERSLRNDLTEQKLSVGKVDLGYQNIKYQRKYLLNEIARCHDMETFYQDVPLVPLDEFHESAPENLRNAPDDHQLMLNRLQFELEERKRFDAEKRRLLAVKIQLTKANKARKAQLSKVEKQLESYIESSQSLQDLFQERVEPIQKPQELLSKATTITAATALTSAPGTETEEGSGVTSRVRNGEPMEVSLSQEVAQTEAVTEIVAPIRMGTTELMKRNDVAQLLPQPLYVLFRHACAFSAIFGEEVRAEIQGDVQAAQVEARVLLVAQQASPSKTANNNNVRAGVAVGVVSVGSPSAPKDLQADDEENVGKGRRGSESSAENQYERYPLDVVIKIKKDALVGSHTIVHLRFGYLTRLGIVVVAVEAAPGILKMDPSLILQELFPRDHGEVCPNPEAAFLGMTSYDTLVSADGGVGDQGSDLVLDVKKSGGYAFRWAQEICGLEFLGPVSQGWGPASGTDLENMAAGDAASSSSTTALSGTGNRRAFLSQVIRMIRNRRRAWKALERQLEDLERGTIPIPKSHQNSRIGLLDGMRTKVSIAGWRAVPESGSKYTSVYKVQFVMPDSVISSKTVSAKIVLVEASVEIAMAYVERFPRWDLRMGPGFPESLKTTMTTTTSSNSEENARPEEADSMLLDDQKDTASQNSKTGSEEDVKERSPFLDALMNAVNTEVPASLYGAEPGERNMLLSVQLARIVTDLSAILDSVSN